MSKEQKPSEDLKPCPFCGSRVFQFGYRFYPEADSRWKNGTIVKCLGCRVDGPEYLHPSSMPKEDAEKAAEKLWNERSYEEPMLF